MSAQWGLRAEQPAAAREMQQPLNHRLKKQQRNFPFIQMECALFSTLVCVHALLLLLLLLLLPLVQALCLHHKRMQAWAGRFLDFGAAQTRLHAPLLRWCVCTIDSSRRQLWRMQWPAQFPSLVLAPMLASACVATETIHRTYIRSSFPPLQDHSRSTETAVLRSLKACPRTVDQYIQGVEAEAQCSGGSNAIHQPPTGSSAHAATNPS